MFPTPVPEFLKDGHWYRRATWVNVIQPGGTYLADDQLATVYPTNTVDPVFPRLRLGEWSAVSREGWVFPTDRQSGGEYVELQHGRDAFIEWFDRHGLRAVPSDAGRVAEQVIRTVGGLHSCATFADEAVVKLLDDMAATRVLRNKGPEGVEESNYPDRAAPLKRWEDLFRRKTGRMPWVTLDRFTEKPILRAGLEIRCPHCAQRNWFDVKALDYRLTCARCLKEFVFPQDASTLKKLPWLYRVVGPFATPNFARGGYAVALALRALGRGLSTSDVRMTWSTGLELMFGPQKKVEIDFAAWCQRDALFGLDGWPMLVIGEAKSFAMNAITKEVIDGLKVVAELFPGAFLAVAVLKNKFSAHEKARLTALAKWGRRRTHEGWPDSPAHLDDGNRAVRQLADRPSMEGEGRQNEGACGAGLCRYLGPLHLCRAYTTDLPRSPAFFRRLSEKVQSCSTDATADTNPLPRPGIPQFEFRSWVGLGHCCNGIQDRAPRGG